MTTLMQFYRTIQEQLLSNPESADYEVAFVDETTQTEIGTTPVGLNTFIGCSDDVKKFDFYCNLPQETVDEYMENRSESEKNYICGSEVNVYNELRNLALDLQIKIGKKLIEMDGKHDLQV